MAPGEARDHQPGPGVRQRTTRRGRLIAQAARHPDRVVGFQDATWRTGLARPDLLAGTAGDPLRSGANARDPKGGGPEAVACYGVLRQDTGGRMLRFCGGRPVGATTEAYLGGVRRELAAEGKRVLGLAWDDAAWHVSKRARRWIDRHNRRVRGGGGCRLRVRGPPTEAPWRTPIEPKGVHGKRAVVEPDRRRTAEEPRDRAHDDYGCPKHPPVPKAQA